MLDLNSERCPRCFRKFTDNLWHHDPILTEKGSKFVYDNSSGLLIPQSDESKRYYKGLLKTYSNIIKDLQDDRIQAEINAGISEENRTIFSSVDFNDKIYLITKDHIKELRESTEKILSAIGMTKDNYFNYDELGNERQYPHQTDWIDPILDTYKGLIKAEHIEDLRKALLSELPVYFINDGRIYESEPRDGDTSKLVCYNSNITKQILVRSMITYFWFLLYRNIGTPPDGGFEYINRELTGKHQHENGNWYYPEHPVDLWQVYPPEQVIGNTTYWKVDRFHYLHTNPKLNFSCIPINNNLNLTKLDVQELKCNPILIDETPQYPCVQYVGDTYKYAYPKLKSPSFLEDILTNLGISISLTSLQGDKTAYFKTENIPLSFEQSSVNEDTFDERHIDFLDWTPNFWIPPALREERNVWGGVGISGSQACGNCSVFVPSSWLYGNILSKIRNKQLSYTFSYDSQIEGVYLQPRTSFLINLGTYELESIINPVDNSIKFFCFGENCLLAKENLTQNITGAILAKGYNSINTIMNKTTIELNLPEEVITRSVKMVVNGYTWRQVSSFDNYGVNDKVFIISEGKILIGDGINGWKVPSTDDTNYIVNITCYTQEIPITKYYPSGHIVVPYDENLLNTSCYIYIEYYNAIWNYNLYSDPYVTYASSIFDNIVTTYQAGESFGLLIPKITPLLSSMLLPA